MVALTQTLLSGFGSKVVLPSSGILMNNGMMWFDPRPEAVNCIAPGKRPLTNMCPVIATRGGSLVRGRRVRGPQDLPGGNADRVVPDRSRNDARGRIPPAADRRKRRRQCDGRSVAARRRAPRLWRRNTASTRRNSWSIPPTTPVRAPCCTIRSLARILAWPTSCPPGQEPLRRRTSVLIVLGKQQNEQDLRNLCISHPREGDQSQRVSPDNSAVDRARRFTAHLAARHVLSHRPASARVAVTPAARRLDDHPVAAVKHRQCFRRNLLAAPVCAQDA